MNTEDRAPPANRADEDKVGALLGKVRHELEILYRSGIVEIAVRNPAVAEYARHWEDRATRAEAANARMREALEKAKDVLGGLVPSVPGVEAFQAVEAALALSEPKGEGVEPPPPSGEGDRERVKKLEAGLTPFADAWASIEAICADSYSGLPPDDAQVWMASHRLAGSSYPLLNFGDLRRARALLARQP